jgi:ubiquinone/menaquinone biosynthesis C-methylase UbiE
VSTLDALSQELMPMSRRGLRMLLDGLVSIGLLEKSPDSQVYRLPQDVKTFLVEDHVDYIGGLIHHGHGLMQNWSQLTDTVRTGQPSGGSHGLTEVETYYAQLIQGLYVTNQPVAQHFAQQFSPSEFQEGFQLLDVGGGSGVWSIALAKAFPQIRATLLDYPSVIEVARQYVEHNQVQKQFSYWAEDLELVVLPGQTYDAVLLANVCHLLGAETNKQVLKKLMRSLKPGGEVWIVDFAADDARSQPGWALRFAVNMLVSTMEGDVFTESQYRQWLTELGHTQFSMTSLGHDIQFIRAKV